MVRIIVYTIRLIAATIAALLFNSCGPEIKGDGNRIAQERNISGAFDRIEVGHGIELTVEQSGDKRVSVTADANLLQYIYTRVENGTLFIGSDHSYSTDESPEVFVSLPELHGLNSNSGSHAKSRNTIVTSNLKVVCESGAQLDLDVEADEIAVETSSGSNAKVSGKALKLKTSSSSGSSLDASDLETNDVESEAESGSSTTVHPINSLTGKASSGGGIGYTQKPKVTLSKQEESGGSVSEH